MTDKYGLKRLINLSQVSDIGESQEKDEIVIYAGGDTPVATLNMSFGKFLSDYGESVLNS